MIDENLIFITLIIVFIVFITNRSPKLIATIILIVIVYYIYKSRYTNPREFIAHFTNIIKEGFEPCSTGNLGYCGNDSSRSDITFLPDILRSAPIKNDPRSAEIKPEDYQIDKRMKMGTEQITVDQMISTIPPLLDYKIYLEKVIKFVLTLKTDDTIQKDFLARKLRHKMTIVFYNAYNTVNEKKYPINTYNELLYSQREFDSTMNIFIMLGLDEYNNNEVLKLQKEFKEISDKVNQYVIEKVNNITPNDYDITTSFLPNIDEPVGLSAFD
jgi:hypothetical protein